VRGEVISADKGKSVTSRAARAKAPPRGPRARRHIGEARSGRGCGKIGIIEAALCVGQDPVPAQEEALHVFTAVSSDNAGQWRLSTGLPATILTAGATEGRACHAESVNVDEFLSTNRPSQSFMTKRDCYTFIKLYY